MKNPANTLTVGRDAGESHGAAHVSGPGDLAHVQTTVDGEVRTGGKAGFITGYP